MITRCPSQDRLEALAREAIAVACALKRDRILEARFLCRLPLRQKTGLVKTE
jgi:hypothetical protein